MTTAGVRTANLTVPSRVEFVRPATLFVVHAARALDVAAARESVFEVAISEALTNAVKHGGRQAPAGTVSCEVQRNGRTLTVRIMDDGPGFALPETGQIDETLSDEVEAVRSSGYGLRIIRSVFPRLRVIEQGGRFGVELELSG